MQELSWDDLKVLLACSRHGSTRLAAAALGVVTALSLGVWKYLRRPSKAAFLIERRMVLATTLCEELLPSQKPLRIRYPTASYA